MMEARPISESASNGDQCSMPTLMILLWFLG